MASAASVRPHRASRDIIAQLVLRGTNIVLGVFVAVMLVRTLGQRAYGEWSTIFAVLGIVGYFTAFGMDRVAVERATTEPEQEAEWVGALVTLRTVIAIPIAIVAFTACFALADSSRMRTAAAVICIAPVLSALSAARIVFQLQVRNARISSLDLVQGIAWAGVVAACAAGDAGLITVAVSWVVLTALYNAAQTTFSLRSAHVAFRGVRRLWGPLIRLAIPVGISGLLIIGYGFVDQIIVFRAAGPLDAGLYGADYRMFTTLQFIPSTLLTTLFPIIVAARDDDANPERVRRMFTLARDYLVIAALPGIAVAAIGARDVCQLLFGDAFADAGPGLLPLMIAFAWVCMGYLTGSFVIAYKLQWRFVRYAVAALAFNVVGNLLLVPEYGYVAAAWMTLATEILVTGLTLRAVMQALDAPLAPQRLARAGVAVLAAAAVAWGLSALGAPVLVWIATLGVAYAAALLATRAITIAEVKALLMRKPL